MLLASPVHPSWTPALGPVSATLAGLEEFLAAEAGAGRGFLPAPEHVLRALSQPLEQVRVLLVGQDPYPTPGHAVGLAFSTAPGLHPLPRTLGNVLRELADDTACPPPRDGDLSPWAARGVLMLNRVLTVSPGAAGSHRRQGWEVVTEQVVRALATRQAPLVAVLWGRDAQAVAPLLGDVPRVQSAHPSPLSASRGFLGSRPFSRVNELLQAQGADPVDWSLPAAGQDP